MKPKKPIPWRRRTGRPYWVNNERVLVKGPTVGPRKWTTFALSQAEADCRVLADLVNSPVEK